MSRHDEVEDGMGFAGHAPSAYDREIEGLVSHKHKLKAEIERLQSECAIASKREQAAWAERDQYMNSNVKLVAEIERRKAKYPYSELDMDMHVEAVTKDLRAANERLRSHIRTIESQSMATTDPNYIAVPARLITEAALAAKNTAPNDALNHGTDPSWTLAAKDKP